MKKIKDLFLIILAVCSISLFFAVYNYVYAITFEMTPEELKGFSEQNFGAFRVFTVQQGGTGIAIVPTYGQLLVGNNDGTYTLTATSSLGITAIATMTALPQGNVYVGNASNEASATSSLYITPTGSIGINNTSPSYQLDINGTFNAGTTTIDGSIDINTVATGGTQPYQIIGGSGDEGICWGGTVSGQGSLFRFHSKDGDSTDSVLTSIYGLGTKGSLTNRERLVSGWNVANSQFEIFSEYGGTGVARDLALYINGNNPQLQLESTNGYIGIGTSTPAYTLDVYGNARINNDITTKRLFLSNSGTQSITASTTAISSSNSTLNISSDADYVLMSKPSIASSTNGHVMTITNTGSFTIELQDNSILGGSSIFLGGANGVIAPDEIMTLIFIDTIGGWKVQSHPNSPTNVDSVSSLVLVRNTSGSTIGAGAPVYITGYNVGQGRVTIGLADADDSAKNPSIGLTTASIANNTNGTVIANGTLSSLNTSAYDVNDALYLSNTAGQLTDVRPTGTSDCVQAIARVSRASTNGVIQVIGAGRCNDIPNTFNTTVTNAVFTTATTTNMSIAGWLKDGDGDKGTSGELLSYDGTDLDWITHSLPSSYFSTTTHENIATLPSLVISHNVSISTSSPYYDGTASTTPPAPIFEDSDRTYQVIGCKCDATGNLLEFEGNEYSCGTSFATSSVSIAVTKGAENNWEMGFSSASSYCNIYYEFIKQ